MNRLKLSVPALQNVFRPKQLILQGFKAFRDPVTFDFPPVPGLNMLSGPNGIGKTSIWDGLTWVLYGKTTRGQKAGNVANWARDFLTSASLTFEARGHLYIVLRTWDPNAISISLDGGEPQTVAQGVLEGIVGMDYEAFLNTVVMGQFGRLFFDLSPNEKLAVLSGALGLEYWERAADHARGKVKTVREDHEHASHQFSEAKGTLRALKRKRDEITQDAASYAEGRAARVKQTKAAYELAEEAVAEAGQAFTSAKEDAGPVEATVQDRTECLIAQDDRVKEAQRGVTHLRGRASEVTRQRDEIDERLRQSVCPTCGKPIDRDKLKKAKWGHHVNRLALAKQETAAQVLLAKRQSKYDRLSGLLHKAEEVAIRWRKTRGTLQSVLAAAKAKRDATKEAYDKANEEENPFAKTLEDMGGEIVTARETFLDARDTKGTLDGKLEDLEYWAASFRKVRLWLVEEAINQLAIEVNNALVPLGLAGWEVAFSVERETKAGGVTKGFSVLVRSPGSPTAVPWESWSGGQTQRLRIAGAVGLAELLASRSGCRPTVEVWDEPTTYLDEQGTHDLMGFLRDRSEFKQIWLVDHRALAFGGFDHVVRVVPGVKGRGTQLEPGNV